MKVKKSVFLLFLISFSLLAQDKKIEREKRISEKEMPEKAMGFLNSEKPEQTGRTKYYFETDGTKISYEAKFKYRGYLYSVEFDTTGNLQDIEVELKATQLPEEIFQKITDYLKDNSDKHSIEKIQAQFIPLESADSAFRRSLKIEESRPDNYEIVASLSKEAEFEKLEILFDYDGEFLKKRKVIRNNYDYFPY